MNEKMNSEPYTAPESEKELIKCGTFLQCYCPHCNLSLNQGEDAVLDIINCDGDSGEIRLSPYLCIFSRFEDPAEATGTNKKIMSEFNRIRDEIQVGFREFYEEIKYSAAK